MTDHDANQHNWDMANEASIQPDYESMSLAELTINIDAELLEATTADILSIAPENRAAAIADFAEIDPILGQKLALSVAYALS